jgi:cytochrome c oxidase cbb3-type subunit 4
MSMTDVVSHSGLAFYAEVAMVLFILAFLAIVVWVFRPGRTREMDRAAHLPLEDDEPTTPRPGATR